MDVSEEEFGKRKGKWKTPEFKAKQGTLYKYIKVVGVASGGVCY